MLKIPCPLQHLQTSVENGMAHYDSLRVSGSQVV